MVRIKSISETLGIVDKQLINKYILPYISFISIVLIYFCDFCNLLIKASGLEIEPLLSENDCLSANCCCSK